MSERVREKEQEHGNMQSEEKENTQSEETEKTSNDTSDSDSGSGGLLSAIGDPAGKALHTTLRPLGSVVETGITGPLGAAVGGTTRGALGPLMGEHKERAEVLGGANADSYGREEKIGGKEQTGENPLGLDQTGRWGFRE